MSIRLTAANSEYLSGVTPWDHNKAYTWAAWLYWLTVPASNAHIMNIGVAATEWSDFDAINTNASGKLVLAAFIGGSGADNAGTTTISTGTWYHVALVRSAANDAKLYLDGVEEAASTDSMSGRSTADVVEIGRYLGAFAYSDIRIAAMKVWDDRALTVAQIVAEMRRTRPIDFRNLYGWWPFASGNDTGRPKDWSGKGRDWTENNTPTTEADPTIGWGEPGLLVGGPAADAEVTFFGAFGGSCGGVLTV